MIQKMDVILHLHQEHQAKVHSSLENTTTRLGNIEIRLSLSNLKLLKFQGITIIPTKKGHVNLSSFKAIFQNK